LNEVYKLQNLNNLAAENESIYSNIKNSLVLQITTNFKIRQLWTHEEAAWTSKTSSTYSTQQLLKLNQHLTTVAATGTSLKDCITYSGV